MLLELVSVASPLSTYLFPKKIDEDDNYLEDPSTQHY